MNGTNTDGCTVKRVIHHGAHRVHRELRRKNSVLSVFSVVSFPVDSQIKKEVFVAFSGEKR